MRSTIKGLYRDAKDFYENLHQRTIVQDEEPSRWGAMVVEYDAAIGLLDSLMQDGDTFADDKARKIVRQALLRYWDDLGEDFPMTRLRIDAVLAQIDGEA